MGKNYTEKECRDDDVGMHPQKKGVKKDKPDHTRGMALKAQPRGKDSPVLEQNEMSLKDAIQFGIDGKLDEMRELIHQAMYEKAVAAADNLKQDVASKLFAEDNESPLAEGREPKVISQRIHDAAHGAGFSYNGAKNGWHTYSKGNGHSFKYKRTALGNYAYHHDDHTGKKVARSAQTGSTEIRQHLSTLKEETVLTELSQKRVGKYLNQASRSVSDMRSASDQFMAAAQRRREAAGNPSRFKSWHGDAQPHEDKAKKLSAKATRRAGLIAKASKRIS